MSKADLFPIAVLISGNGSNLQAIMDACGKELPAQVSIVISDRSDAWGLRRAQKSGVPYQVISPKDYPTKTAFEEALITCIEAHHGRLIALAGFMRVLGPSFVEHFKGRIINIHPSLLPKYPGLHTHQRVLKAGDHFHGTTIHFVTNELDAGPIIAQKKLEVAANDTPERLKARIQALEHVLYPSVIKQLIQQFKKADNC